MMDLKNGIDTFHMQISGFFSVNWMQFYKLTLKSMCSCNNLLFFNCFSTDFFFLFFQILTKKSVKLKNAFLR